VSVAEVLSAVVDQPYDPRGHAEHDDSEEVSNCEPLVDVLEDDNELLVLIEILGGYSGDVTFRVKDDILVLVDAQDQEYHEILLPEGYDLDEPSGTCFNNGVITIRHRKIPVYAC
jgi:HSP20 family molecular chaperone IbpA